MTGTPPAPPRSWLTVDQFAELVQLSSWTVRQHIRTRHIPATYVRNIGGSTSRGRRYRISPKAVDAFQL